MSSAPGHPRTPQEIARLLIRSRNWHLKMAGEASRQRAEARARWADEEDRHAQEAERLEAQIRALGFDPQPPMGPRAA